MPQATTYEDGFYSCIAGKTLLGKLLAGRGPMKYTRAAIGKGELPEGTDPRHLTEPPGYVMDGQIANVSAPVSGECHIAIQVSSANVETAFLCTGVMLYAEDPDLGEVPYTFFLLHNDPAQIRGKHSNIVELHTFDLVSIIDDVETVTAVMDPEAIATRGYVDESISRAKEPMNRAAETTIPASRWVTDSAGAHVAIPARQSTEDHIPTVVVMDVSAEDAVLSGVELICTAVDGSVIVYADSAPTGDIVVQIKLSEKTGDLEIDWEAEDV